MIGAGIATVEKLGSMTPEDLAAIEGIEAESVELIQTSVISYYQQFDAQQAPPPPQEFVEGMPIQPPLGAAPPAPIEHEQSPAEGDHVAAQDAEPVADHTQTHEEKAFADEAGVESDNIKNSE